jgi:heat shock protein HslJ
MKKFQVRAVGAVCLALLVAGCSSVSAGSDTTPGLDGSAWMLSHLPGKALVPESSSTLQFAAGRASGSDSCNRFGGAYTPDKSALSFGQLASTQMACTPELMEQARAVTTALTATRSHRINADTLKFGAAAATRMLCATAGLMEQEQAFLNALGTVATFRLEGERLELHGADGALAASFRRMTGSK